MLSERIKNIKSSSTLDIQEVVIKKRNLGEKIIAFTVGQPDFDTPDYIKQKAKDAIDAGFTKYTAVSGIEELKEMIANKLLLENNLSYNKNQIVVTNGGKHALMNVMYALLDKDDEVIIPTPYWLSYVEMVKIVDAKPILVETKKENDYKITAYEFEKHITDKTKLIIINSPNNPTGAVYSKAELEKIADIAKKHNIFIISDEVYEYLNYTNERHYSIAEVDEETYGRTVIVNSLSKSYAMTGWRVGYIAANEEIASAIGRLQAQQTSNVCSIAQMAGCAAFDKKNVDISKMINEFAKRREIILNEVKKIKEVDFIVPNGAFYLLIDCSELIGKSYKKHKLTTAKDIAENLLKDYNVAIIPCEDFGMRNAVRLSYAISVQDIINGMNKIREFVEEVCARN